MKDFKDKVVVIAGRRQDRLGQAVRALADMGIAAKHVVCDVAKAGAFFIVSHAYNMVRIDARHGQIADAYARYAPRYDGDDEFDARSLIAKPRGGTA